MKISIPVFIALLFVTNMSYSSTKVSAIFPHHSMGALLLGSRSQGDESLYAKPEQMHLCRRGDELNRAGEIELVIHHHDRDKWESLRDCENNLIDDSWGEIPMGSDGNTPEHWNSLFIENQWPGVREKLLAYDVIIIKNSYQTVQDDHSPDFKEDPSGAFTIVDKTELWQGYLNALGEYFSGNYPDKTLIHLGPAPRRALGRNWWNPLHYFTREGNGINYPSEAVARSSRQFASLNATDFVLPTPTDTGL